MKFEYKVIAAPRKASRVKGLKRGEDKFAASLEALMNSLGAEGWEYQRTDTLPVESRAGLTGHATSFHNMLVFRRVINEVEGAFDVTHEAGARPENPPEVAAGSKAGPEVEPPQPPAQSQHHPVEGSAKKPAQEPAQKPAELAAQ